MSTDHLIASVIAVIWKQMTHNHAWISLSSCVFYSCYRGDIGFCFREATLFSCASKLFSLFYQTILKGFGPKSFLKLIYLDWSTEFLKRHQMLSAFTVPFCAFSTITYAPKLFHSLQNLFSYLIQRWSGDFLVLHRSFQKTDAAIIMLFRFLRSRSSSQQTQHNGLSATRWYVFSIICDQEQIRWRQILFSILHFCLFCSKHIKNSDHFKCHLDDTMYPNVFD